MRSLPNFIGAALLYAEKGYPIFPLSSRSKLPLIPAREGGKGLYDATTDLDAIRSWWTEHPTANLGLRTGIVCDAIDIDEPAGREALDNARNGHLREVERTVASGMNAGLDQPRGLALGH